MATHRLSRDAALAAKVAKAFDSRRTPQRLASFAVRGRALSQSLILVLALVLGGATHRAFAAETPHFETDIEFAKRLPRSTAESQGVSSSAVRNFVEAADQQVDSMHSFMLVRHGHVVAEGWWSPEAADKPHILWSLSKSFTSTAIGLAVAEGKLSIDDKVLKFFPEDAPAQPSENLQAMRVRDLLTMSTGHAAEPWWTGDVVWTKRFFAEPVVHKPGSIFRYNTPATYMQSAIVQKVTGQTVVDYLTPRLFEPLGIAKPTWDQSPQGISIGGYGLYLRTEDIAKFGQLYLQQGKWNGKQIVPAEWIAQATSKQIDNDKAPSGGNPDWRHGYGFQFWQCRHGAYRGDGKDGQFCIVLPAQDAVIAITAKTRNLQLQLDLVWEHLLPAFHDQPLPENAAEADTLQATLSKLKLADPFLQTPAYVGTPKLPEHAPSNRAFQGIPSMAVAAGARLWANWYAGVTPGEDQNNYVAVSTSGDDGKSWREVLVIDPDGPGPLRAFDPELWVAPTGRLFVFWAQSQGHDGSVAGVWCVHTDNPDDEQPNWSQPRRLTDGIMMCKPMVLSTGEWVLPASTWRTTDSSARMIVSTTLGRTWSLRGACNVPKDVRAFDEHIITERNDGSLWLLARTKYGIGESVSTDRGKTWPELKPSKIAHPSARFFIRRLQSGNLLLVKHGKLDQRSGRSHLTAYVSSDDGKTWTGGLLLDERSGVSYPDGQQTEDGTIRVIYDFSRTGSRHILMATFREEDVAAGKPVQDNVRLRQLVSEASGGREKKPEPVRDNADGEALRQGNPGLLRTADGKVEKFIQGAKLFTDRTYRLQDDLTGLDVAYFLRIPLDGRKTLTCDRTGTVWFLTPTPDRNKDSCTAELTKQGFKKVSVPEVRLFNPKSTANFCTLYQKDCESGDTITIGKWAVPLFLP